jgi:hypothetical protein
MMLFFFTIVTVVVPTMIFVGLIILTVHNAVEHRRDAGSAAGKHR